MKPRYFLTLAIGAACLLGGFSGIGAAEDATTVKGKGFDMSIKPRVHYFIVNANTVDENVNETFKGLRSSGEKQRQDMGEYVPELPHVEAEEEEAPK